MNDCPFTGMCSSFKAVGYESCPVDWECMVRVGFETYEAVAESLEGYNENSQ